MPASPAAEPAMKGDRLMPDQEQTGNIFGTAVTQDGQALPGVTVTLLDGSAPRVQATDEEGTFSFLGLAPGSYEVKAALAGFIPIEYPKVVVNAGHSTEIEVILSPIIG
jgi:carboxypeptidase family protein